MLLHDICDALRDLVPFAQFKNVQKPPWTRATFSKVAGLSLQLACNFTKRNRSVSLGTDPPKQIKTQNFSLSPEALKNLSHPGRQKTLKIPTCCLCLTITLILISEQPINTSLLLVTLFDCFN